MSTDGAFWHSSLARIMFALTGIILFPSQGEALTEIGGILATNTVLRAEDSPYHATLSIVVTDGAQLTIEPGCEIRFAIKRGLVVTEGTLVAAGTYRNPIRLAAYSNHWGYVGFGDFSVDAVFTNDVYIGGSILKHVLIEDAGDTDFYEALHIEDASPLVEQCEILDSTRSGIYAYQADGLRIRNTVVRRSGENGIFIQDSDMVRIEDCHIAGSDENAIRLSASHYGTMRGNRLERNVGAGCYTYRSSGWVFDRNVFFSNNNRALYIDTCHDFSFSGNIMDSNAASLGTQTHGGCIYMRGCEGGYIDLCDPTAPNAVINNSPLPQVYNDTDFQFTAEPDGGGNVDARNVHWEHSSATELADHVFGFCKDASKGIVFTDEPLAPFTLRGETLNGFTLTASNGSHFAEFVLGPHELNTVAYLQYCPELSEPAWHQGQAVYRPAGTGCVIRLPLSGERSSLFFRISPRILVVPPQLPITAPPSMVHVAEGVNMGTDPAAGDYSLRSKALFVDRYEVTKAEWDYVSEWAMTNGYDISTNSAAGKATNHPVQHVTWYDCLKWCNARSEMDGRQPCYTVPGGPYRTSQTIPDCNFSAEGYRLPTVEEWQYAARGGTHSKRFAWGSNVISHNMANYKANHDLDYDASYPTGYNPSFASGSKPYTSPIGFPEAGVNGYGLYNIAGNVREWCWDNYYAGRKFCGGDWDADAAACSVIASSSRDPASPDDSIGFRTVITVGH
jgi:formylglycine-generating enzyme